MNRSVDALNPVVARKYHQFDAALAERGLGIKLTCTLRTAAEQAALVAQGREHVIEVNRLRNVAGMASIKEAANRVVTHAITSMHQFGCAFDIALKNKSGGLHWDTNLDVNMDNVVDYIEAGRIGEALGFIWGGRFRNRDYCHFEYTGGLTLEQLQQGMRPAEKTEPKGAKMKIDRALLTMVVKTAVGMSIKKDVEAKGPEAKHPVLVHKRIFGIIGTALFGGLAASSGVDINALIVALQGLFNLAMEHKQEVVVAAGMVHSMGLTLWGHVRRGK